MTAPVFTSPSTHRAVENTFLTRYRAVANDPDGGTVTYSITGGADASLFKIDSMTGILNFKSPSDDENNIDADGNGIYLVEITATDDNSPNESSAHTIAIEVIDDNPFDKGNIETLNGLRLDGTSIAVPGFRISGGDLGNGGYKAPPITLVYFSDDAAEAFADLLKEVARGKADNFRETLNFVQSNFDFPLGVFSEDRASGSVNINTSEYLGFEFVNEPRLTAAGRNPSTGPNKDNYVEISPSTEAAFAAGNKYGFYNVIIHEALHEKFGVHRYLSPRDWTYADFDKFISLGDVRNDEVLKRTAEDLVELSSFLDLTTAQVKDANNDLFRREFNEYKDRIKLIQEVILRLEVEYYLNNDGNDTTNIPAPEGENKGIEGLSTVTLSASDIVDIKKRRNSLTKKLFDKKGNYISATGDVLKVLAEFRKDGLERGNAIIGGATLLNHSGIADDIELTEEERQEVIGAAGELGRATGTQISNSLGIENPLVDFIADVGLTTLTENFAEYIKASNIDGGLSFSNFDVLNNLPVELVANVNQAIDARQGQISDYLTGRFLSAIAVNGFAGHLIGTFSDVFLNNLIDRFQVILTNIADPDNPDQDDATDDGRFFGVVIEDFKDQLRADAEILLEGEIDQLLDGVFGTNGVVSDFADAILDPLVDFGVDTVLDYFRNDNDQENFEALIGAFTFESIKNRVVDKGREIAADRLSGLILGAVGVEGNGVAAQFGRALTKEVVETVISIPASALGVGEFEGLDFNSLLAQVPNLAGTFAAQAVVNALGVTGEIGDLLGSVIGEGASALTSTVLNNVFGTDFQVSFNPANLVASFAIGQISNLVGLNPAGQLGANIGGTIGSLVGTLVPGIGPILGKLFGTVLGGLIGSLFGTTPRAGADIEFNPITNQFTVGTSFKRGKGDRELVEGIAGQVIGNLNDVISATGGAILNPEDIVTGHFGQRKDYLRFQLERGGDEHRFSEAADLVSFGTFVALENAQIAGGNIYVKRALNATLENQKSSTAFTGVDGLVTYFRPDNVDSNEANDLRLDLLLGNISTALEYSSYLEDPTVVNALLTAYDNSPFAAGWVITLQRAIELGLHRRHVSDWFGGFGFFLEDQNVVTGSLEFTYDTTTNERLITFTDESGEFRVLRDYVNPASKDIIEGNGGNNVINIVGSTLATNGNFRVNGETHNQEALEIDVAAVVRGGLGNDTIRGGDRGNDLFGEAGNDLLEGGATADFLSGGNGADTLRAIASDDGNILHGDAGNDLIEGAGGSDSLEGGSGRDTLNAGGGDDILAGGTGAGDQLHGGGGDDIYIFNRGDGNDQITDEAFTTGLRRPRIQTSYIIPIYGTQNELYIRSIDLGFTPQNFTGQADHIVNGGARGGEDTLVLGSGIELSDIGLNRSIDGADLVVTVGQNGRFDQGVETITLNDWFDPFNKIEWLEFADGQRIRIGDFSTFTLGTEGGDVIIGTNRRDFAHGAGGNDVLQLFGGDDLGVGGAGFDFVSVDSGNDIALGGDQNDVVLGGSGNDIVSGDSGDDQVYGDSGNDIVTGGVGNDTLVGGAGNDVFVYKRGDGSDRIFDEYSAAHWQVVQSGNLSTDSDGRIFAGTQLIFDGENWHGNYRYVITNEALQQGRIESNSRPDLASDSGTDIVEFGIGIEIEDIHVGRTGNDLVLGIANDGFDNVTLSDIEDQVVLANFFANRNIERLTFFETGTLDISSFEIINGGTASDDNFVGSDGRDWFTGGSGNDVLDGGAGSDLLVGHSGQDTLIGGDGIDTLLGGSGDDVLEGGEGRDSLFGGEGFDIASYENSETGVTVEISNLPQFSDPNFSFNIGGIPGSDVFHGIEGVVGSSHADQISGDDNANQLNGGDGNDTLAGRGGDDVYVFDGGNGIDVIHDKITNVQIEGIFDRNGNILPPYTFDIDFPEGPSDEFEMGVETIDLDDFGKAIIRDSRTNAIIFMGDVFRHDIDFRGGVRNNPFEGTLLGIQLAAAGFEATGNGAEIVRRTITEQTLDAGNDTLEWLNGDSLSNLTFTSVNNLGNNAVNGSNLRITNASGAGVLIREFDTSHSVIEEIVFDDGLTANLSNLRLNADGGAGDDLIVGNVGNINLNTVNDDLSGGGGNDVIVGGNGNDTLSGDTGDDTLIGGIGSDSLIGGAGVDVVTYAGSGAGISVDLNINSATGGEAAGDLFNGIEGIIGSNHNDVIRGNTADNQLYGGDGNDSLFGSAGENQLSGGVGRDTIGGGNSADTISGGEGDDRIDANGGNDIITAGSGNDSVNGDSGDDFIDGGDGNDTLNGDEPGRTDRRGEDNILGGAGDDLIDGGYENDTLLGGEGRDTVIGGEGDDNISGGSGVDILHGNQGNDLFVHIAGDGADTIVDTSSTGQENRVQIVGLASEEIGLRRNNNHLDVINSDGDLEVRIQNYYSGANRPVEILSVDNGHIYISTLAALNSLSNGQNLSSSVLIDNVRAEFNEAPNNIVFSALSVEENVANGFEVGTAFGQDADSESVSYRLINNAGGRFAINQQTGVVTVANSNALDFETSTAHNITIQVTDSEGYSYEEDFEVSIVDAIETISGTSARETLSGGAGDDSIVGNGGGDRILGREGNDTINGGTGRDTITGETGQDVIYGHEDRDYLYGREGNDRLFGGVDNDILYGGLGADIIDGGEGSADYVSYHDRSDSVIINLDNLSASSANFLEDTILNVERYQGSRVADQLIGDAGANFLDGGYGNDTISGGAGNDSLQGHRGNDIIEGGDGNDLIYDHTGNDTVFGGGGNDRIRPIGNDGVDVFDGGEGFDNIYYYRDLDGVLIDLRDATGNSNTGAAAGDQYINIERIYGGRGDDTLIGNAAGNDLHGHRGVDILRGLEGNDTLNGHDGDDLIEGGFGNDLAYGGNDDDQIEGGAGNDNLFGQAGNDTLVGGVGNDTITGGDGVDLLVLSGVRADYTITASGANYRVIGPDGDDLIRTTETVRFTGDNEVISLDDWFNAPPPVAGNGAPSDIMFTGNVAENAANGTIVGDASHADPDGDSVTYSLTNNAGGRFQINADSGVVTVADGNALNAEVASAHTISIRVTDPDGLSRTESFTINVTNVNEAPTDIAFSGSVSESAGNGTVVGDASHSDPENNGIRYSLANDAGGRFAINATTGIVTVANAGAINSEAATAHTIRIRVQDNTNLAREENFTINVTNVNEAPTDIAFSGSVSESAGNGTVVGDASHSDPEDNGIRYSLANDAGGRFAINATTGVVTVANAGAINFESAIAHTIRIRVQDNTNLAREENFTINVTNVNEAPTDIAFVGSVSESVDNGAVVGDASHSDPENNGIRYSLTNNAGGRFAINASTGVVTVANAGAINFEASSAHTIRIRVRDNTNLAREENFTINVTNVNEAPTDIVFAGSISETASNGTVVGDASHSDPENNGIRYSLANDAGGRFAINAINGVVSVANAGAIDFEATSAHTIRIRVRDNTNLTREENFTINVTNVNEAPTIVRSMSFHQAINGNLSANTVLADIDAVDPDGTAISYRILGSVNDLVDPTRFSIDSAGRIRNRFTEFSGIFDMLIVEASDAGGLSVRTNVDISYIDIGGDCGGVLCIPEEGAPGGGGFGFPIVLDLDGDGLELTSIADGVLFDINNDGIEEQVAWVGEGDGLLVLDRNNDGVINNGSEISFVDDLPGANTDLEGLAAFDTNGDWVLNNDDQRFENFQIWQDRNQDGISQANELISLADAGVVEIDLLPRPTGASIEDGTDAVLLNTSQFTRIDQSVSQIGDVAFGFQVIEGLEEQNDEVEHFVLPDSLDVEAGEETIVSDILVNAAVNEQISSAIADATASEYAEFYAQTLDVSSERQYEFTQETRLLDLLTHNLLSENVADGADITGDQAQQRTFDGVQIGASVLGEQEAMVNRLVESMASFDQFNGEGADVGLANSGRDEARQIILSTPV